MTLLDDRVNHLDNCIVPSGAIFTLSEAKGSYQQRAQPSISHPSLVASNILSLSLIVANINWFYLQSISHLRKILLGFSISLLSRSD